MEDFNKKEFEIFKTSIKYTKAEYLKLNKFHSYVLPRYLYISVYALIFTILTFGIYLNILNKWVIVAIIAGILLFTAYIILLPYMFFNSSVKNGKINLGMLLDISFYNSYFKIYIKEDGISETKYYNSLYKAYETRTNFYLYIDKVMVYIIPKKKVSGNVSKLRSLLKSNLNKDYIRLV